VEVSKVHSQTYLSLLLHPYLYRLHRRTFHQHFQARVIETYHPVIRQLTSVALRKLIRTENEEGQIPDVEFNELFLAAQQYVFSIEGLFT